jgi:nucleoside-diphosphate-sugar epimerase
MKMLLTGASGFVGKATLNRLVDRGADIIATSTTGHDTASRPGIRWQKWNATDTDYPNIGIDYDNIDAIVHLASPRNKKQFPDHCLEIFKTNTFAALELAKIAASRKIQFVYISTGDVFGGGPEIVKETETTYSPSSFYASTKASTELLLQQFSHLTKIAILRVFHPYGPGGDAFLVNKLVRNIEENELIRIEQNGGILLNPVWIEDLADGICNAVEKQSSGTYHLAGNDTLRLNTLIEIISGLTNKVGQTEVLDKAPPGGHAGDFTRAKKELEFFPTMDITTGLQKLIGRKTS